MNDFKKEYHFHKKSVDSAITKVLESGWYILGKESQKFEEKFARYIGSSYCIGVANGLEAIQISLIALGIEPGDEVITVSNSAVATALAISNIGASAVFVDIDKYYHMDIEKLKQAITPRTKAIIPVHLFGQLANIEEIVTIAKNHDLKVIEDACQAHGASLNRKKAGSFGNAGCFSFYPTKNLGTYGDGGAITTNSKKLYEKCKMLRNYGQTTRYKHEVKGINSRLDEVHSAILTEKLKTLDKLIKKRNDVAKIYLSELQKVNEVVLPMTRNANLHTYHLFVIQAKNRDSLRNYLKEHDIEAQIHYPIPIHKQQCYPEYNSISLPITEYAAENVLSLPIHPFLSEASVKKVSEIIKDFYNNHA